MSCSCIKGNYNFNLQHVDCGSILYQDLSDWMSEYTLPEKYDVLITPPVGEPVALSMYTTGVNIITETDLSSPVEDGIYCFRAISCGVAYTRHKAVTCVLNCKLDHFISSISKQPREVDIKKANMIENYIKAIHYNTERGFLEEAEFYYDLAKKELDCFNCKCK